MSTPKKHHIIPKVYLKQFQIDNDKNKNFVFCCDFSYKHNQKPVRIGIDHKIFKQKNFYFDKRLEDPYSIEKFLGQTFESTYNNLIEAISEEVSPPEKAVTGFMGWLFQTKLRSPALRKRIIGQLTVMYDVVINNDRIELNDGERDALNKHIEQRAKEIQLEPFSDMEKAHKILGLYITGTNVKQWRVLKSSPELRFWTNDNPGFSPNFDTKFANDFPYHDVQFNFQSFIYFVLSPKYCLEISPFFAGTPLTVNALNMKIEFEQASSELIHFINKGVFHTKDNLLISNSLKSLNENLVWDS